MMSSDAAAKLLANVRADSKLQARLGPSPSVESYMEEARRQGLEFTVDDFRGVINAEQFYQKASNDPELFKRVSGSEEDAVVALAAEEGFACRLEDLKAVLRPHQEQSGELSDEDLEQVAGGMLPGAGRYVEVSKSPAPPAPFVPIPYPNISAIESDAEDAKASVDDAAEFVKEEVFEPTARFTRDATEWTVDKAEEGMEATKERVVDPTVDVMEDGARYVNETVLDPVVEAVEEAVEQTEEAVEDAAEDTEEWVDDQQETLEDLQDDAEEVAEDVSDAVEDAYDYLTGDDDDEDDDEDDDDDNIIEQGLDRLGF